MVCGAALNYKWKQKGLSSAFSPERDSDSLAQAGTVTKQEATHIHTAQYMQTCQLHHIQPFRSFSLHSYTGVFWVFLIKLTCIFLLVSASCWTVVFAGVQMLLLL